MDSVCTLNNSQYLIDVTIKPATPYLITFTCIFVIEILLNCLILSTIVRKKCLFNRSFSWFIIVQCVSDILAILIRLCLISVNQANNMVLEYFGYYFYCILLTLSFWLLTLRCYYQMKAVNCDKILGDDYLFPSPKYYTLKMIKLYAPLFIIAAGVNLLLPFYPATFALRCWIFNFNKSLLNHLEWYKGIFINIFILLGVPVLITIIFGTVTIWRLIKYKNKNSLILQTNYHISKIFHRRTQSTKILCVFVILVLIFYIIFVVFDICLYSSTFCHNTNVISFIQIVSDLYFCIAPCVVFALCKDVRKAVKLTLKLLFVKLHWKNGKELSSIAVDNK